jgi:ubiquinone/menaquinone biosynthesis C-methylase UbiE
MRSHLNEIAQAEVLKRHLLLLGILVLAGVAVVLLWPSMGWAMASVAGTGIALHAGVAMAGHLTLALTAAGLFLAVLASQASGRTPRGAGHGATLHAPRFYDLAAAVYCFGREARMRTRMLEVAGVAPGEHVLDVCCGTGTLALAAQRWVGDLGSVHGLDASEEMIAHARSKAARQGLPVAFEVAPAQAIPFDDATFDVVLCTLALHHLPEGEPRAHAIEEMRRVAKPGGRVLVVEFGADLGAWAVLHPVALLHRRKSQVLAGVTEMMKGAGFNRVVGGQVGFAGLGYTLAHRT